MSLIHGLCLKSKLQKRPISSHVIFILLLPLQLKVNTHLNKSLFSSYFRNNKIELMGQNSNNNHIGVLVIAIAAFEFAHSVV